MPFALSIIEEDFKNIYNVRNIDPFYMTTCYKLKDDINLTEFQKCSSSCRSEQEDLK